MKRIPFLFTFALFLLLSHATPTLFAEASLLNLPQTVHRMARRGWRLKELQRIPGGSGDYFAAVYRWKEEERAWRWPPQLLMIYRRQWDGGLEAIETGREFYLGLARDVPRDINNDDRPEVTVEFSTGGNGWAWTWFEIYTLAGGKATRLISPRQGHLVLRDVQDVDGDGMAELIFLDTEWELAWLGHTSSPGIWHYWGWDVVEGRYKEDPQRFWMVYEKDIHRIMERIRRDYQPPYDYSFGYYLGDVIELFLTYQLLDEPQRGWAEFEALLANAPPLDPNLYFEEMSHRKEKVNEIRTDLAKRFPLVLSSLTRP